MPSSFRAQSETYSSHKSHNTAKGLVGVAPSGMVTFISCLYGDIYPIRQENNTECGLIHLLESGDVVMAEGALIYRTCLLQNV